MSQLLSLRSVSAGYGRAVVLHDLDLDIEVGEVVALLGGNGAGKTTTLRAISGMLTQLSGSVTWEGTQVTGSSSSAMARHGLAHVPEGRGTLLDLTVEENLRVGAYLRGRAKAAIRESLDACYGYFPVLGKRRNDRAGGLSGGEQQMLAVSRGLMMAPRLMLLDEPSLGLAPNLVHALFETLRAISGERRMSMLIVEQNAALALELATRAHVIETGRIVLEGTSDSIRSNEALRRAYLGY